MSHPRDRIRVLHVDDEPDVAELAAEFLEREDDRFTVETATSAEEGLARLDGDDFDCVVSDYDMPGTDGLAFLDAVREESPELPFVLFTGKGSEEVASEAIRAGATDYLRKRTGAEQYELLANRITNAVEGLRAERRARRRDRQYRALFEQAPIMYVLVRDEDGRPVIEDCNDRFTEKLGYDREEVLGHETTEFFTEESARKVYESGGYERALDGTFGLEKRTLVTKDGEEVETILRASPRLDEHGTTIGVQTLYLDVTEREERLRELETYEAMIETVPDGVYALDEDLRYTAVNEGMVELTGYPKEELVGSHLSLLNDEESVESATRQRERLGTDDDEDGVMVAEHTHVTADGERIPCEVRFRRLPSEDGFRGTAGVVRDVSDYRERERALERYETIIEASGDPVYTLDADGRLTFVNDAFCDLVGYAEEALIGEYVSVVMDETDIERGEGVIRDLLETDADRETFEMDLIRADGRRIPCETHVALLPFEEDEEFRGTTGIHRVIARRKRREEALRALHEATGAFMRATDDRAIAERAVETARTVLDQPINGLWLYDEADGVLEPAAITDEGTELLGEAPTYTGDGSLSWQAFEDGELRVYDDVREESGRLNPDTSIRSELILPLGEHGVMNFGSTEPGAFDEVDVSLARILAGTVEAALGRTGHRRKLERIQRRTERLMETSTVEETARIAVEAASTVLGAPLSGFHRATPDGRRLEPVAVTDAVRDVFGTPPTYDRTVEPDPVSALVWDAYESREPVEIDDAEGGRLDGHTPATSGIVYPIDGMGVFVVSATEPDAFDETDRALLDILASALASALQRVERESSLRDRQRELERTNERLEEFASVVSHDLRNPLNVAEGRVRLASEEYDSEHLDAAVRAHERMGELIDDLLTLARDGESAADVEPVALAEMVEGCWETVTTANRAIAATLVLEVETAHTIRADRSRLRQLLENLMANAVEHGSTSDPARPDDGAGVTVTVGTLDDGPGFYVEDDGPGIPEAERDRVFESGYSTAEEGTGFGLAIVREIADAHGWNVRVTESEAGGARFEITGVETA